MSNTCVAVLRSSGEQCGYKVKTGSEFCGRHQSQDLIESVQREGKIQSPISVSIKPEKKTRVVDVHVKSLRPEYDNLEEWMENENNVYIGREGVLILNKRRFPEESSIWANPYTVKKYGRQEALELYEKKLREKLDSDPTLVEQLLELKGKTLGCWCNGSACHGDVLVKLIREYDPLNIDRLDENSKLTIHYLF